MPPTRKPRTREQKDRENASRREARRKAREKKEKADVRREKDKIRKQVARAKERELREEVKKLIMSETPSRNLSAEAAAAYETLHSLDKEKRAAKEKAEDLSAQTNAAKEIVTETLSHINFRGIRADKMKDIDADFQPRKDALVAVIQADIEDKKADTAVKLATAKKLEQEALRLSQQSPMGGLASHFDDVSGTPTASRGQSQGVGSASLIQGLGQSTTSLGASPSAGNSPASLAHDEGFVVHDEKLYKYLDRLSRKDLIEFFSEPNINKMNERQMRTALGLACNKDVLEDLDPVILKKAMAKGWPQQTKGRRMKRGSPMRKEIIRRLKEEGKKFGTPVTE